MHWTPAAVEPLPGASSTGVRQFDLTEPPVIVLDTNVVFDWLVFADPACAPLRDAIERRLIRWIATPRMRDECFHVIGRGALDGWAPNTTTVQAAWADHCSIVESPPGGTPLGLPRCSDADDQMFIDLAVACRARWLLSRDRAVLRLAGRLARLGVAPVTPEAWTRLQQKKEAAEAASR